MMNFWIDSKSIEDDFIQFESRSISGPTLYDIDLKKMKWLWYGLPLILNIGDIGLVWGTFDHLDETNSGNMQI